jgi:hypothetical protein
MKFTETGAALYHILSSDTWLSNVVGNRIFPLMAVNATTFPFIAYKRSDVSIGYTKDRIYQSDVTIDMVCVSIDYKQGVDIADRVVWALLDKRFAQYDIDTIRLKTAFEDYADDAFVQALELLITIDK